MAEKPRVIHFPIIHTDAEAGNADLMVGLNLENEVDTSILWDAVRGYLSTQRLDFRRVKVYCPYY